MILFFLRDCGANIACATRHPFIDPTVTPILVYENSYFCAAEDFLLPTSFAAFVLVESYLLTVDHVPYSISVESLSYVLEKK